MGPRRLRGHGRSLADGRPPDLPHRERRAQGLLVPDSEDGWQMMLRVDGQLRFNRPKTESLRTVPVPGPALEMPRRHREDQAVEREASKERWQDFGPVFPSRIGNTHRTEQPGPTWYRIRAAAGLDWPRPHDLRHASATFLLTSGASARTVMKPGRHSQIALTMNTFTHVLPEIERR